MSRAGFAPTIYAARPFVSHAHVEVNGKKVNIPSYSVKPGDVVSVNEKSKQLQIVKDSMERRQPAPAYLSVSEKDLTCTLVTLPQRDEVPIICDVSLVVEFYARQ